MIARPADWRKLAKPEEVGLSGAHTIIVCEPGPIVLSRLPHFVCTRLSLCEVAGILWPELSLATVARDKALLKVRQIEGEKASLWLDLLAATAQGISLGMARKPRSRRVSPRRTGRCYGLRNLATVSLEVASCRRGRGRGQGKGV